MAEYVPLPPLVESLIQTICAEQSRRPPESPARRELAALGEENSLRLLQYVRTSRISRSFDGFIFYLAKHYCSPGSPGRFASPAPEGVTLPESVEELILRICEEQSRPRLGMTARRQLAALGGHDALRLLESIRRSKITKSFDGFVMYMAKSEGYCVSSPCESVFSSPSSVSSPATPMASLSAVDFHALGVSESIIYNDDVPSLQNHLSPSASTCMQAGRQNWFPSMNNREPNEETFSSPTYAEKPDGRTLLPYSALVEEIASLVHNRLSPSNSAAGRQACGQTASPSMSTSSETYDGKTPPPYSALAEEVVSLVQNCLPPTTSGRQASQQADMLYMNDRNRNEQALSLSNDVEKLDVHTSSHNALAEEIASLMQKHLSLSPAVARQPRGPTKLPSNIGNHLNEQNFSLPMNFGNPSRCIESPSNTQKLSEEALSSYPDIWKPNVQALSSSINSRKGNGQTSSPLLQALDELEFRRAFLILCYTGRNKLENVITVGKLRTLATINSMGEFENELWNRFGSLYCEKKDRIKHLDWDSGSRYYYHCYVYSDASYAFKGPYLNKTTTHLQKVLGDEHVLIVKFCDTENSSKSIGCSSFIGFNKVAEEGIFVGLRRFQFFVFKDGGKEGKKNPASGAIKSYFVNMDSFARFFQSASSCSGMISVHEGRCIFMHVHTLSSISAYMARFSLILSKTITLDINLDDPDVHVEVIEDIPCKGEDGLHVKDKDGKLQIHTDGTGFISEELALRCPRNCYQGSSLNDKFLERYLQFVQLGNTSINQFKPDLLPPPLLIQFRMFHKGRAVKGTVLVNKKLQGKRIQIRPSMIKVEPDPTLFRTPSVNSFEIVTTSNRPRKPRLSRYLIALLNYGGVPREFFVNMLVNEILCAKNILSDTRAALKVAMSYGDMDDNYTVARMILSGIPIDESYIQWRLPILGNEEKKSLKEGRLPVEDSFYVMGTADPTGTLNDDEVCIIHENGQIVGDVLVYRHPGVHFGDIHLLKATYVEHLENVVGNSKYGIFFPTKGPRSLADKMAGGDFDGDLYWVSKHPQLLKSFKQSEPWTPTHPPQSASVNNTLPTSAKLLEPELFRLFLNTRFHPSMSVGQAAQSWLCCMDQLLCLDDGRQVEKLQLVNKILKLVDLYYDALDAPKKGKKVVVPSNLIPRKWPHYMGRGEQYSYKSNSILGEIFDKVDELKWEAPPVQVRKLQCFDIEVPLRSIVSWDDHYRTYRSEMAEALKSGEELRNDAAASLIQKYKRILYEADELEKSPRAWEEIRLEALAIYHVVYEFAIRMNKASYCGFVWRVAGPALIKVIIEDKGENPIFCLPSVLREVL